MKIEIKNRWNNEIIICGEYKSIKECLEKNKDKNLSGANLSGANLSRANLSGANLFGAYLFEAYLFEANLSRANLSGAYLFEAYLSGANLSGANLSGADLFEAYLFEAYLSGANLSGADLSGADLSGADLSRANLSEAKGINKYLTTPLYSMLDQKGVIRAYKLVNEKNEGPFNGGIVYKVGEMAETKEVDTNEFNDCGEGINLASLDWCIKEYKKGNKILIVEFKKEDIACIPVGSDGKFRVYRCKIIGEKDLKEIGIQ